MEEKRSLFYLSDGRAEKIPHCSGIRHYQDSNVCVELPTKLFVIKTKLLEILCQNKGRA